MITPPKELGLKEIPFEPAGTGAPLSTDLWLPSRWKKQLLERLDLIGRGRGVKALPLIGEYGSGKSYVLQWLSRQEFPSRDIKPFYFDNPGVQFYDLANYLLRDIGRKEFAKSLFELASPHIEGDRQRSLFATGFNDYLRSYSSSRFKEYSLAGLQQAIERSGVTTDEEIARRLALIIAETPTKPYFEYRDFVAGKASALVAEGEEARYFGAILRMLRLANGIKAVAFLIDEFEEVSLLKKLSKREAHDYLATLKRLLNLTQDEDFWVVVAMTQDGVQKTQQLDPALWERFTAQNQYSFTIPLLEPDDAYALVKERLDRTRPENFKPQNDLFPFPDNMADSLAPVTTSTPRRLVKFCFYAISDYAGEPLPFTDEYLRKIERKASIPKPDPQEAN